MLLPRRLAGNLPLLLGMAALPLVGTASVFGEVASLVRHRAGPGVLVEPGLPCDAGAACRTHRFQVPPLADAAVVRAAAAAPGGIERAVVAAPPPRPPAGGLEVALVVDAGPAALLTHRLRDTADAAQAMVRSLWGDARNRPDLWMAVVAAGQAVNIGPERAGLLAPGSLDAAQFEHVGRDNRGAPVADGQPWRGCVAARQGGEDVTDANPATAPLRPYHVASTRGAFDRFPGRPRAPLAGDNDWSWGRIEDRDQASPAGTHERGPNQGCALQPVLPLSADRDAVLDALGSLRASWSGGSLTAPRLQAGWWTLSPKWRGRAGWGSPGLPHDYRARQLRKVLILSNAGEDAFGVNDRAALEAPSAILPDSMMTPYGRASATSLFPPPRPQGGVAATQRFIQAQAVPVLTARALTLCRAMRERGIVIYGIEPGEHAEDSLVRRCASPGKYVRADDRDALLAAFRRIGAELAGASAE